jgi:type IV secretion system protein VirB9
MIRSTLAFLGCYILFGCAHHHPPDIPLDKFVEAKAMPDPQPPIKIVEIPKPIPMPEQLKPLPELSPPAVPTAPAKMVNDANIQARMEPTPSGWINAMQVWPFSPAALYHVYTMPGMVTDITLEAGEDIFDISAPDTIRWIIGDTRSGTGQEQRRHVIVKPTRPDLHSNLAIFTSRRTYHLELQSTPETWIAAVSWDYPQDTLRALKGLNQERAAAQPIAEGLSLQHLEFRYAITGDKPSWRPLRAFDDHEHVYIQFPAGIAQGEMPPLFVLGAEGDAQLVNYRVRTPYYIVDRLFGAAELRLGGKKAQTVRIERTDRPRRGDAPKASSDAASDTLP